MNNTENKKLIAEFMGYQVYPDNNCDTKSNEPNSENSVRGLEFMFQDWNELMLVVEKIEILGFDTELVYRLDDGGHCFYINDSPVFSSQMGSKIEATYEAVVEFIKWHNSAKENTTDQLSNTDLGQSTII